MSQSAVPWISRLLDNLTTEALISKEILRIMSEHLTEEPGPEAFIMAHDLLEDLAAQMVAIPDELIAVRYDKSLHSPIVNWTVYCVILLSEYCSAAAALSHKRHARVLTALLRTTYEFCIGQLYVVRHPELAREQFATFYGRSLRKLAEMQPKNQEVKKALTLWNDDAKLSKKDSYSGNFNNKTAIVDVDGEEAYGIFYSQMSTFAHPDAAGYSDVFSFDFQPDGLNVYFRDGTDYHAFDALCMIGKHSLRALRVGVEQLKISTIDVAAFEYRLRELMKLHFNLD